jgi:hypothetical protein
VSRRRRPAIAVSSQFSFADATIKITRITDP